MVVFLALAGVEVDAIGFSTSPSPSAFSSKGSGSGSGSAVGDGGGVGGRTKSSALGKGYGQEIFIMGMNIWGVGFLGTGSRGCSERETRILAEGIMVFRESLLRFRPCRFVAMGLGISMGISMGFSI